MQRLKKHSQETTEIRRLVCILINSAREARDTEQDECGKRYFTGKLIAYAEMLSAIDCRFNQETLKQ